MIAFLDVDYRADGALAACVLATQWTDERPAAEIVTHLDHVADYEPGNFYRRELPCLLSVLTKVPTSPMVLVVDGYAWLGDGTVPGLGACLHEACSQKLPVVGVAKSRYRSATAAREVFRGGSKRPLYVTAAGMTIDEVVRNVELMHGSFRMPTLLKRVDELCRQKAV